MIKFLDILKESDDNIFIPRGSKEEKDKILIRRTNDKIQEYIRNGSEGNLVLMSSPIKVLPKNLTKVGGKLILMYSQIEKLPDNLRVNKNLDLEGCKNLKSLPDNLIVNGYLDLEKCKNLESLPNGLKVKNFLDIRDTNITSLPSDLEVGGDLILLRTPIADMYTKEQIRYMVPGLKGGILL
jgi:hypothetical protein